MKTIFLIIELVLPSSIHRKYSLSQFHHVVSRGFIRKLSTQREYVNPDGGTVDRRLVKQEKAKLEEIYQREVAAFLDHLR